MVFAHGHWWSRERVLQRFTVPLTLIQDFLRKGGEMCQILNNQAKIDAMI